MEPDTVLVVQQQAAQSYQFLIGPIVGLLAGGAAGAIITLFFTARARFWSRYSDLERLVIEHPFLYELWDQAGDGAAAPGLPRFASAYTTWQPQGGASAYMSLLDPDKRKIALVFLEMWGDFVVEMQRPRTRAMLGGHTAALTDRARQLAKEYDVFPGSVEARRVQLGQPNALVPDGRNGVRYGPDSLRKLGLM